MARACSYLNRAMHSPQPSDATHTNTYMLQCCKLLITITPIQSVRVRCMRTNTQTGRQAAGAHDAFGRPQHEDDRGCKVGACRQLRVWIERFAHAPAVLVCFVGCIVEPACARDPACNSFVIGDFE